MSVPLTSKEHRTSSVFKHKSQQRNACNVSNVTAAQGRPHLEVRRLAPPMYLQAAEHIQHPQHPQYAFRRPFYRRTASDS